MIEGALRGSERLRRDDPSYVWVVLVDWASFTALLSWRALDCKKHWICTSKDGGEWKHNRKWLWSRCKQRIVHGTSNRSCCWTGELFVERLQIGGLSGKLQKGPGPMIVGLQFRLFMCPLSLFYYVFLHLSSHLCFESCLCSYVRLCAVLSPFWFPQQSSVMMHVLVRGKQYPWMLSAGHRDRWRSFRIC